MAISLEIILIQSFNVSKAIAHLNVIFEVTWQFCKVKVNQSKVYYQSIITTG